TTLENFKSGPMFLQISVADAPYRMTVQDLYQANTMLDCSKPERQLSLDLGPVGDGMLHWKGTKPAKSGSRPERGARFFARRGARQIVALHCARKHGQPKSRHSG